MRMLLYVYLTVRVFSDTIPLRARRLYIGIVISRRSGTPALVMIEASLRAGVKCFELHFGMS